MIPGWFWRGVFPAFIGEYREYRDMKDTSFLRSSGCAPGTTDLGFTSEVSW